MPEPEIGAVVRAVTELAAVIRPYIYRLESRVSSQYRSRRENELSKLNIKTHPLNQSRSGIESRLRSKLAFLAAAIAIIAPSKFIYVQSRPPVTGHSRQIQYINIIA